MASSSSGESTTSSSVPAQQVQATGMASMPSATSLLQQQQQQQQQQQFARMAAARNSNRPPVQQQQPMRAATPNASRIVYPTQINHIVGMQQQQQQQQQQQRANFQQQQQRLPSPQQQAALRTSLYPNAGVPYPQMQRAVGTPMTNGSQVQARQRPAGLQQVVNSIGRPSGMTPQQRATIRPQQQQTLQAGSQARMPYQMQVQTPLQQQQWRPLPPNVNVYQQQFQQRQQALALQQQQQQQMHQPRAAAPSRPAAPEPANRILGKRSIQELVAQVDARERLEPDVEDALLEIADDFIEKVTTFACALAKHRKSTVLEAKDVLVHLERSWQMTLPGFGGEEYRAYKKPAVSDTHKQRLAVVKRSLAAAPEAPKV